MSKMAANRKGSCNTLAELGARCVLFAMFMALEFTPAFVRVIHDEELWLYKNPKSKSTISTPMLFVISACLPTAVITVLALLRKDSVDLCQALLALTLTLGLNGVTTNVAKVLVGRPRPDYFWRCYPNGAIPPDKLCDGDPDEILEGRKSFPSGHSSFAFCGLGFLALYFGGKLHCFQSQGRGQGWRLCIMLAPLISATALALTRYSDYRHHWQDVTVGSALGLSIAYLCYRQYYPALHRPHCHLPYCAIAPARHLDDHDHLLPLTVVDGKKMHPVITKSH